MIEEYFSIEINDQGELVSLPVILPGHAPSLEKLPLCEFTSAVGSEYSTDLTVTIAVLLRIGIYVDWENESECFESLATELAFFYSPTPFISPPPSIPTSSSKHRVQIREDQQDEDKEKETKEMNLIKNVFYPAFKQYLIPSDQLITGKKIKRKSTADMNVDGKGEEKEEEVGEKDAIILITRLESLYKVFERC
jgi:DNA mismatch repair protein MLH1